MITTTLRHVRVIALYLYPPYGAEIFIATCYGAVLWGALAATLR